jgi:hypothetical protein
VLEKLTHLLSRCVCAIVIGVLLAAVFAAPALSASGRVFTGTFGGPLSTAPNPFPLSDPTGVAVDEASGDTYVVDTGAFRIEKFSGSGEFLLMFGKGVNKTKVESKVASEAEENVCTAVEVALGGECQTGVAGAAAGSFSFAAPGGLQNGFVAVDNSSGISSGDVYVGDAGDGLVSKFTPSGELLESWGDNGPSGSPNGQLKGTISESFGAPLSGIAIDSVGHLWVAGTVFVTSLGPAQRVFEFDQDGAFAGEAWRATERAGFAVSVERWGIAIDRESDVYLSSGFEPVSYLKFSSEGAALGTVATLSGSGFALDSSGVLYLNRADHVSVYAGCHPPRAGTCEPTEAFGFGHPPGSGQATVDSGASEGQDTLYVVGQEAGEIFRYSKETVPGVITGKPATASTTMATLSGTVDPSGIEVSECFFEYGETEAYGARVPCEESAAEIGTGETAIPVHAVIGGLQAKHAYHYRLVSTNAKDVLEPEPSEGRDVVFGPPEIESEGSADVAATSATVQALIDPRNLDTRYHVEYLTQAEFEANGDSFSGASRPVSVPSEDVDRGSAEGEGVVEVHLAGLMPNTAYAYRFVAVSSVAEGAEAVDGERRGFTTEGAGALALPDARRWEQVSPVDKQGAAIQPIGEEAPTQATADGAALTYGTLSPTEDEPAGFVDGAQVLSSRGSDGSWSSHDIAVPHPGVTGLSVGRGTEPRLFSEDLSSVVVQPFGPFERNLSPEATEQTAFLRSVYSSEDMSSLCLPPAMHCYTPLVNEVNETSKTPFGEEGECPGKSGRAICGPEFVGADPSLRCVVLESHVALTVGGAPGLYMWEGGSLVFIGEGVLGGPSSGVGAARHAVSDDCSRVFFSDNGHLFMRDISSASTIALDIPEAGCGPCGGGAIDAVFQGASADGSRAFFTDTEKLTVNGEQYAGAETRGADLYECEVLADVCKLSDIAPSSATVGSVAGISEDGASVYFAADNVLEDEGIPIAGAVNGDCPSVRGGKNEDLSGKRCDLYVRRGGTTALIGVLSGMDIPDWSRTVAGMATRVSPDGNWFAFMSQRALTGYDNTDAASGRQDEEVFLFDRLGGRLACVSCSASGARPHGVEVGVNGSETRTNLPLADVRDVWSGATWLAGSVPGWTPYAGCCALRQSRYLSDEGRLIFDSSDSLVPRDVNGTGDVYEYEPELVGSCRGGTDGGSVVFKSARPFLAEGRSGEEVAGCVGLLSSGTAQGESAFLEASESGGDVFFLTGAKLAPTDLDGALDVYDAHACGTASACQREAVLPPACATIEGCRAAPAEQPGFLGAPASESFSGLGSVTPKKGQTSHPNSKCKKGFVRRKARCVRVKRAQGKKKHRARRSISSRHERRAHAGRMSRGS